MIMDDRLDLIYLAAHKYCLPRNHATTKRIQSWFQDNLNDLSQDIRRTVVKETIEAISDNTAGHNDIREGWKSIATSGWESISDVEKEMIANELKHKFVLTPDFLSWMSAGRIT